MSTVHRRSCDLPLGTKPVESFFPYSFLLRFCRVGAVRDFGLSSDDDLPIGLIVNSSGSIFFSQPTTIRSACALNVADFPFDDQTCQLTFGSWTMDSSLVMLDLRKEGIDMTQFVKNSKWDVLQISPEVRMHDNFQDNDFSLVVYTIMVRRKSLFFIVNYLIPSVVILALSLLLFLIPPEVGKRMGKNCSRLLTSGITIDFESSQGLCIIIIFNTGNRFYLLSVLTDRQITTRKITRKQTCESSYTQRKIKNAPADIAKRSGVAPDRIVIQYTIHYRESSLSS